eukprot:TRINITY_DN1929_c0_g2_i1.p1 TRINITY_DN1929_c0_g2~~TRINITY_DN1929_c0_g2_i1.p1  ORF type:complete len:576 (-),score=98.23 TRINITY_DN1929_c0_g2_i1:131-1858(-)
MRDFFLVLCLFSLNASCVGKPIMRKHVDSQQASVGPDGSIEIKHGFDQELIDESNVEASEDEAAQNEEGALAEEETADMRAEEGITLDKYPNCDFEKGMCGWSNDGPKDWTRATSSPSRHTGPSGDHTSGRGYFIYTEASGNGKNSDFYFTSANFNDPKLHQVTMEFWFHMYGHHMGELRVIAFHSSGNEHVVWGVRRNQGNRWHKASVALPAGTMYVRFKGRTGNSYQSDIAIDDITFTGGGSPSPSPSPSRAGNRPPISCTFEKGMCGWRTAANSKAWTRLDRKTPSYGTGPSSAAEGKWYVYTEASHNFKREFGLESANFPALTSPVQMQFKYNMYGSNMGSLNVMVKKQSWLPTPIFRKSGNQGRAWKVQTVTIPEGATAIMFYGKTGSSYKSDMAIDDITLTGGGGPSPSPSPSPAVNKPQISCTFETGMCGWKTSADSKAWTRLNRETPSSATGPSSAAGGKWYVYTEASGSYNKNFGLESADFGSLTSPVQFQFKYNMYGQNMGTLNVMVKYGQTWSATPIFSKSGDQGKSWKAQTVTIPKGATAIMFYGRTGASYRSDMAIDDLKVL